MDGIFNALFCDTLELDSVWDISFFFLRKYRLIVKYRGNSGEITYLHTFPAADSGELTGLSSANHSNQRCRRRRLILRNFPMKVCMKTSTFHPFFPDHPLEVLRIEFVTVSIHHAHGLNVIVFPLPAQGKPNSVFTFRHSVLLSDMTLPLDHFMCVRISAMSCVTLPKKPHSFLSSVFVLVKVKWFILLTCPLNNI